ncbi:TRAP transporter small permease [Maritalea porphyrae]|uniref:TRAP transporter small permease n=1 Tax=Maritalea porphyrae TaxID=880732 RepID=UPI0022AFE295|nr:TRAP transporter small permease [Maritalea porphyrae]MCZ4271904.1 TRAP transporter small permease [Maritalea porphyrae]
MSFTTPHNVTSSTPQSPSVWQKAVHGWAMFGGVILLAVVLVNFCSAVLATIWRPIPGDLELTEMGVAIAAFAFLPYCQLTTANVSADIFTARASPKMVAVLRLAADFVALAFALILLWRMSYGMLDQFAYGYTTSILRLPHWFAFVPILASLLLLALSALMTLRKNLADLWTISAND